MKRVIEHFNVHRGPLAIAGLTGSILLGLIVGSVGASSSSKLTDTNDSSAMQSSTTSVDSGTASQPSVVIDGTPVPVGKDGQTTVDTANGPANVSVSGNSVTVTQNKVTNNGNSSDGSVQLNVSSSNTTASSSSNGWNGNNSTTTQSQQNVYSYGVNNSFTSH